MKINYRQSFLLLILIIVVGAAAAFAMVYDTIDAPPWAIAIASVLVVGGGILTLFPNLHDSTEFVKGLFSQEAKTAADLRLYETNSDVRQRNRENFLANIHSTWVEGALKRSLHNAVRIELGLSVEPDSVSRSQQPWELTLQKPDTDVLVPTDKSIVDIFADWGRSLLILGAPGSGKTITLLQLAEELVVEAKEDGRRPIPVVLNLSSWGQKQLSLAEWVAEEVFVQYQVPTPLTHFWLTADQLVLLLDGLDEVAPESQNQCVTAINHFKKKYGAEIVVCSRETDYELLHQRLNLSVAVRIKPLKLPQIQKYLAQFGPAVEGFKDALSQDTQLQALAASPLMLSLVPVTYGNLEQKEIPRDATEAEAQHTMFSRYVRKMFHRRPYQASKSYTPKQAIQWLHNLAYGMQQHRQSTFFIERLQSTWLPEQTDQKRFRWIAALISGLLFGPVVWLAGALAWGSTVGLVVGLISGVLVGSITGSDENILLAENLSWKPPPLALFLNKFISGLIVGLIPFLSLGIASELNWGTAGFLLSPIFVTFSLGMILLILYFIFNWLSLDWLVSGLFVGLFVGLILELLLGVGIGLRIGLAGGLLWGLLSGLALGLLLGLLFDGFQRQEAQKRSIPNQSIRQSVRNSAGFVIAGVLSGVGFGLVLWYLDGELWGLYNLGYFRFGGGLRGGLIAGLPTGITLGLVWAFIYGTETVIKHYLLRWFLHRQGILPAFPEDKRLVGFLDGMVDRIFLRRVGGGWQFIHRYLLEYFAKLTPVEIENLIEKG